MTRHEPYTSWKLRLAVEFMAGLGFFGLLYMASAPAWAYVLYLAVATRPSRMDVANDMVAVQSSLHLVHKALEDAIEARKQHGQGTR